METPRIQAEQPIWTVFETGDLRAVAELLIRTYGPELYSFLLAFLRNEDEAAEVFSDVGERIWRGLSQFDGRSSFRTWTYVIARNAALMQRRAARRRQQRIGLASDSLLDQAIAEVRSTTGMHLQSVHKLRLQELRKTLSLEEQELLVLRVDRNLSWDELARVLHEGEGELSPAEERRASARLRKRFQAVKQKLLVLGREHGLVQDEADP